MNLNPPPPCQLPMAAAESGREAKGKQGQGGIRLFDQKFSRLSESFSCL